MRWALPWLTKRVAEPLLVGGEFWQDQTCSSASGAGGIASAALYKLIKSCRWSRSVCTRSFSEDEDSNSNSNSEASSSTISAAMGGEADVQVSNGTHNGTPKKIKMGSADKGKFLDVFKQLKTELLTDSNTFRYTPESRVWTEKMLDYNVPLGKLNRGLSVVDSLALLKQDELTEQEFFLSSTLGWCIEWLQAYFLVEDDIMDKSVTRRGQPCWYRLPKVGLIAVNDGIVLRNHIPQILRRHFKGLPYYVDLLDLFNEVEYQTALGQMLDLITTPEGEVDISKYVISTYTKIVQYKTAYYSFYLPVACALLMIGEQNQKVFEAAEEILIEMGTYFQVQDDFLDCYGDPEFIGKIGTDIEDTKCSWLIVKALEKASAAQKRRLEEIYGQKDPAKVAEVKKIYEDLNLKTLFAEYEQATYEGLISKINKQENAALQAVYKAFLAKIYKRQK
ncbi:unnamed protein product [Calypogeia fissa]